MGQTASQPTASCPVPHAKRADTPPARCPIAHDQLASSSTNKPPAQCPISHDAAALDPRNQMPVLSQAPSAAQAVVLPTERATSTIPRDAASTWEYPSPQQFYNALVRKGWETPEEHVETMVHIHNFLNEQAWQEILKWERKECL